MENKFLKQIAQTYAKKESLEGYTFLFPNRRSSLFFKRYLGASYGKKPHFAPRIYTISELFSMLTSLTTADNTTLLVELWRVYNKYHPDESLDEFIGWGSMILSDFSDIDQYLADAKQIFSNLQDLSDLRGDYSFLSDEQRSAIERLTGFRPRKSTQPGKTDQPREIQKKFFEVWDTLYQIYKEFGEGLRSKGIAYEALKLRCIADAIEHPEEVGKEALSLQEDLKKLGHVVFVGFSAPTPAERVLMRYFAKKRDDCGEPIADFFWDFYSPEIKDPSNPASQIISRCKEAFGQRIPLSFEESECKYEAIGASGRQEQVQMVTKILTDIRESYGDKWNPATDAINTAVVVADEALLFPLLTAIPASYDKKVNITTGYPIRATAAASFLSLLARLILTAKVRDGKLLLLGSVIGDILEHSYVVAIERASCKRVRKNLYGSNMFYVENASSLLKSDTKGAQEGEEPLSERLINFLEMLFPTGDLANAIINKGEKGLIALLSDYYKRILALIEEYCFERDAEQEPGTEWEAEQQPDAELEQQLDAEQEAGQKNESLDGEERLYIHKCIDILNALTNSDIPVSSLRTACTVIVNALRREKISFAGEPLEGLQIMGPLETRLLDFDNIIFLSFNEGLYPISGDSASCIPYFLRKGFSLPTYETRESVSTYNFYRLIQRARRVYFIYDTNTQDIRVKEESRFLKQLRYVHSKEIHYSNAIQSLPKFKATLPELIPPDKKSEEYYNSLLNGDKRLSASSINNFMKCPASFYFSKILGIAEDEELTETPDARTLGSIFHECMQNIYERFSKEYNTATVDAGFIMSMKKELFPYGYLKPTHLLKSFVADAFYSVLKVKAQDSSGHDLLEGENLIIRELVIKYIYDTLNADSARLSENGEKEFTLLGEELCLTTHRKGIKFIAFLDRVDITGSVVRVSDYKTGDVGTLEKKTFKKKSALHSFPEACWNEENIDDILNKVFPEDYSKKRDKFYEIAFQVLLYASIFLEHLDDDKFISQKRFTENQAKRLRAASKEEINISVYSLRKIKSYGMVTIKLNRGVVDRFNERLETFLEQFKEACMTSGFPLTEESGNDSACSYCDFKKYCGGNE